MKVKIGQLSQELHKHKRQCIDIVRFMRGILDAAAPNVLEHWVRYHYALPSKPIITIIDTVPLTALISHLIADAARFALSGGGVVIDMFLSYKNGLKEVIILVWSEGALIPNPINQNQADNDDNVLIRLQRLAALIDSRLTFLNLERGFVYTLLIPINESVQLKKPSVEITAVEKIISSVFDTE